MKNTFSILGGGIAGLTAAVALKRAGIEVQVFEAAPRLSPAGSGITLAKNALKAYKLLGLEQSVISDGQVLREFIICDEKGKAISENSTDGEISMVAIHRARLHDILMKQLEPQELITGKRAVDLEKESEGYKVSFEDGSTLHTKYLIVGDGIHSVIRKKLDPASRLRYAGYTCWRGVCKNEPDITAASETWGPAGRFGIVPIGDNQVYWFACVTASPDEPRLREYRRQDIASIFRDYHHPVSLLILSTPEENIILHDIYDLKPIAKYAFGNAILIGDAAHATTPNMGQGACQAIEDAVVLAHTLQKHSGVDEAFRAFEQKRMKRTHSIVNRSWRLGKTAQLENRFLAEMRNLLFRSIPQGVHQKQLEKVYDFNPYN